MAQLMRTSNPVLNQKRFESVAELGGGMTLEGTVNKTGVLLLLRDGYRSLDMASL